MTSSSRFCVAQARKLLTGVRPRDVVGKTRKRHAMELVVDLERIYQRKKAANKELIELIKTTGTGLIDLHGIGPSGAARLLVEVGDITRFPDRGHFASWTGTAPIDASSGDRVRHRLSRGGNQQINMVLHLMAVVQLRNPTKGRAYYDRKIAAGKSPNEAMRCLKRRLSDIVYRTMLNDLVASKATGPGGHRGASLQSSAAGSHPHAGSSDKSLPGPAKAKPRTRLPRAS
ncbi:MAG TPA: IS110 family transposase [Actinomycetales bacterium]|nr:IS110 family transposase [Actinomycetales bacterium]